MSVSNPVTITVTISAADATRIQNAIANGKIPGCPPGSTAKQLIGVALSQLITLAEAPAPPPPPSVNSIAVN